MLKKNTHPLDAVPSAVPFNLPVVLSIGPQRCATSWLDRYLRQRGDICLPVDVKEIRYFDQNNDRGAAFYKRHFRPASNHSCMTEITTTCFDIKEAPRRVYGAFGTNVKLICPLRHPVNRSYSLYLHYKRYGIVNGTLEEACEACPQILTSSHYATHIGNWLRYFSADQIKFLFQEELELDQGVYIESLCAYLGLPVILPDEDIQSRYNSTAFSKNHLLAAGLQNSAEFLRRHELYKIINVAKSVGLKDLIFGKEVPKGRVNVIPDQAQQWLERQLINEVEQLETLIGPVPHW